MSRAPLHREAIVAAAIRLFRRQGYAATGLAQIVAESGAPKGSVYHYFPGGKAEIGAAAVAAAGERVRLTLAELLAEAPGPGDALRRYGERVAGWMAASGFRDGGPIATTLLEMAPGDAGITAAGAAAFAGWADTLATALRARRVPAARAAALATLAVSAIDGALLQARVRVDAAPVRDTLDEVARAFDDAIAQAPPD